MRKKYILQLKRRYLWEDIATFTDFETALFYLIKYRNNYHFICRLLEVCCI